jgi:hypothetical protein
MECEDLLISSLSVGNSFASVEHFRKGCKEQPVAGATAYNAPPAPPNPPANVVQQGHQAATIQ